MGAIAFGPIGALGGALAGAVIGEVIKQIFDYEAGQTITTHYETPGTDTYRRFLMDGFYTEYEKPSVTEALFARILPTYPLHCGSIKIIINCRLWTFYWAKSGGLAVGIPLNIKVTFIIPMFVVY